jgi:thiamine biosynthesis protein ThiI
MEAVYFHAPPFTSERAKEKVIDLACLVADYAGAIKLHVVNFADVQMAIYDNCPHEELTIIMKRYMIKIAEELAKRNDCQCTVTGESIGQVSSQTVFSLAVINDVSTLPVFRPCIGMDKQEIVDISEKIKTYETSILPYEDCCTTFVAKHPVTKPKMEQILESEKALVGKIEPLIAKAVEDVEIVYCR